MPYMNQTMTLRNALAEARASLSLFESAHLDAELLLCEVMGCDRSVLYAADNNPLAAGTLDRFRRLVEQRKTGIPVAYLTGEKEFWSLSLAVNKNTLVPRPETECLVERVLALVPPGASMDIADLGTGSGAVALAIAVERPACRITATDISEAALNTALHNARRHDLHNVQFRQGDWLSVLKGRYGVIVSNPPYVRRHDVHLSSPELSHEPSLALDGGVDGLAAIREIVRTAGTYLQPGGWLVIEHGYDQSVMVRALLQAHGYANVRTDKDYAGIDRVTSAQVESGTV